MGSHNVLATASLAGVNQQTVDTSDSYRNPDRVDVHAFGTFVAVMTFEGSIDGSTWTAIPATPFGGGAAVTTFSAPGLWKVTDVPLHFRVRCSSFTSGSASVVVDEVFN